MFYKKVFSYVKNDNSYPFVYSNKNKNFNKCIWFNFAHFKINWLRLNLQSAKFLKLFDLLQNNFIHTHLNCFKNKIHTFSTQFRSILFFSSLYNFIFQNINFSLKYSKFSLLAQSSPFLIVLSFKKSRLFITLKNLLKRNITSLSSGLFIKFFEKKKSFKKNKTVKLLMIKYLRKLLVITKITTLSLVVKKTPVFLTELLNLINTPISHKFSNPIDGKLIEEDSKSFTLLKFLYFIFLQNKSFCKNKLRLKGRIKRKILRKITLQNRLID